MAFNIKVSRALLLCVLLPLFLCMVSASPAKGAAKNEAAKREASKSEAAKSGSPEPGKETPAPEKKRDTVTDSLIFIWSNRLNDLQNITEETQILLSNAENSRKELAERLQYSRVEMSRLLGLFQASKGHATEQLGLYIQIRSMHSKIVEMVKPLAAIEEAMSSRLNDINDLGSDMDKLEAESEKPKDAPDEKEAELYELQQQYRKSLAKTKKSLSNALKKVKAYLTPAIALKDQATKSMQDIDSSLVKIWEDYYFTRPSYSITAAADTPHQIYYWASSLGSRFGSMLPQHQNDWIHSLQNFLVVAVIMATLGMIFWHGAGRFPPHWRDSCRSILRSSWVWIGLGMALMLSGMAEGRGKFAAFIIVGVLVLVRGISSLTWRLRVTSAMELAGHRSPLRRLFYPAAVGILMLYSDLPARLLSLIWALLMIGVAIWVSWKRRKDSDGLPLLERVSYSCAFYFGICSLILTVTGYARLAILLFMLLFALVNILILAKALSALGSMLTDQILDRKTSPIGNAVLHALAVPASWFVAVACAVPWRWAAPGSNYILRYFLGKNYTLGEANFDSTKLLIIVLLFFVFRSLISLGRTSLQHLPERMPHLEKGAIPPLQTMGSYALWVVFALIVLGMVGVNFTSLAVVAGGLSVGIGFGMQNIINNLIGGLTVIFGRLLVIGDYIEIGTMAGYVREVNIRSTILESADYAMVVIPNSMFLTSQFVNWTRNHPRVRRSILVGVAYGTDLELATRLMLECADIHPNVVKNPKPYVLMQNFGASSIDLNLMVVVDNFNNGNAAQSDLRKGINAAFAKNGVEVPFPQLDLRMPTGAGIELKEFGALKENPKKTSDNPAPKESCQKPPSSGEKPER